MTPSSQGRRLLTQASALPTWPEKQLAWLLRKFARMHQPPCSRNPTPCREKLWVTCSRVCSRSGNPDHPPALIHFAESEFPRQFARLDQIIGKRSHTLSFFEVGKKYAVAHLKSSESVDTVKTAQTFELNAFNDHGCAPSPFLDRSNFRKLKRKQEKNPPAFPPVGFISR